MTKEEAYAQFDTSLKQTGAGYFDFYLLHNLGESRTEFFDRFDMWNWVQENLSYMKDFTGLSEKERDLKEGTGRIEAHSVSSVYDM